MTEPYDVIKELGECPECGCKKWVGLTDEDYQILREGVVKQGKPLHWMIEHIEAKLKEKNT